MELLGSCMDSQHPDYNEHIPVGSLVICAFRRGIHRVVAVGQGEYTLVAMTNSWSIPYANGKRRRTFQCYAGGVTALDTVIENLSRLNIHLAGYDVKPIG